MSNILTGLLAAIPLAVILAMYVILRRSVLVAFFQGADENFAKISGETFLKILLACFVGAAFLLGAIAGLVYGWLGIPTFTFLAFGAAVLLGILAVISKQPLKGDKVLWNLAVGVMLGVLIPLIGG